MDRPTFARIAGGTAIQEEAKCSLLVKKQGGFTRLRPPKDCANTRKPTQSGAREDRSGARRDGCVRNALRWRWIMRAILTLRRIRRPRRASGGGWQGRAVRPHRIPGSSAVDDGVGYIPSYLAKKTSDIPPQETTKALMKQGLPKWTGPGLNRRHLDFQTRGNPTICREKQGASPKSAPVVAPATRRELAKRRPPIPPSPT